MKKIAFVTSEADSELRSSTICICRETLELETLLCGASKFRTPEPFGAVFGIALFVSMNTLLRRSFQISIESRAF